MLSGLRSSWRTSFFNEGKRLLCFGTTQNNETNAFASNFFVLQHVLRQHSTTPPSSSCSHENISSSSTSYPSSPSSSSSNGRRVRVRYAPSPTGLLHLGGLRTALFNYLLAKQSGGDFLLRIEDTDQKRLVEGSAASLFKTLVWAGIPPDEHPIFDSEGKRYISQKGDYGPYVQSQRLDIYHQHAEILLKKGDAYRCFCSEERLAQLRESQTKTGKHLLYDRRCLHLTPSEVQSKVASGEKFVIRMKVPQAGKTVIQDVVRGRVEFINNFIDDQVLVKTDGFPTYHLAAVVDDHLMKISHVIRGEEWLSSTPKHVMLHSFFEWDLPTYLHLPLLLNPNKTKLSKRQMDVSVEAYLEKGYSPEAILNFVVLLGWMPDDLKSDVMTLDDMVNKFSIQKINKAGAVVDIDKLNFLNSQHLRLLIDSDFRKFLQVITPGMQKLFSSHPFPQQSIHPKLQFFFSSPSTSDLQPSEEDISYMKLVSNAIRERLHVAADFATFGDPFFFPPNYETPQAKKYLTTFSNVSSTHGLTALEITRKVLEELQIIEEKVWTSDVISKSAGKVGKHYKLGPKQLWEPVRYLLTADPVGAPVTDVMSILGKQTTISRIEKGLPKFDSLVMNP